MLVSIERGWHYMRQDERRVQRLESAYRTPIREFPSASSEFCRLFYVPCDGPYRETFYRYNTTVDDPNSRRTPVTSEYRFPCNTVLIPDG